MILKRYDWRNQAVLPLAISLLRCCALWPWLELARRWLAPGRTTPLLSFPLALATILAAQAVTRLALARVRTPLPARTAVAGAGLVALALLLWCEHYRSLYPLWGPQWPAALLAQLTHWGANLPAPLLTAAAVAYLWWRGILDGRQPANSDDAWRAFFSGLISLALGVVLIAGGGQGVAGGLGLVILTFFAAGMTALAITGLQQAQGIRLRGGEGRVHTSRHWVLTLLLVIVTLLAGGVLLSLLIAPETVAAALQWTGILLDILGRALYILFYALTYLIFLVLGPLLSALQALLRQGTGPRMEAQAPNLQEQLGKMSKGNAPAILGHTEAFRWLGLGILVLGVALVFALALRRFWRDEEEEVSETRETVFSRALLEEQLATLWREWLGRRRRSAHRLSPYLSLLGETPTRRAIRAVYQQLLAWAARQGHARLRDQTPLELQQTLARAIPQARSRLEVITAGYLQARYASTDPPPEQAEQVCTAWDELARSAEDT